MKNELNRSHNGGGVVYLLQSGAIHINLTVYEKEGICSPFTLPNTHTQSYKRPPEKICQKILVYTEY